MIHLNLLPPEQQQRLRRQVKLIRWRSAVIVAVVFSVLLNGVLAGSQWWLNQHRQSVEKALIEQQALASSTKTSNLTQTTRRINASITALQGALPTARSWAHDIALIVDGIPANIQLTTVSLSANNEVIIAGVADTRSDFLTLDQYLHKHPALTNLQTESQASQREDLPFQYTATWQAPTT